MVVCLADFQMAMLSILCPASTNSLKFGLYTRMLISIFFNSTNYACKSQKTKKIKQKYLMATIALISVISVIQFILLLMLLK